MTYEKIEAEALDFLNAQVPEITAWKRAWTNGGRRETQRLYNFPEMLQLYPDEAAIGPAFQLAAGNRRLAMPSLFKNFYSRRGDLWLVDTSNDHIPLERWEFEEIIGRYDLDDTGEPEVFHVSWASDGSGTVTIDVFPKPDIAYPVRLQGYFYLADLPDGDITGTEDFLSKLDPLLLRDFISREALVKLEMWDSAAQLSQAMSNRALFMQKDAKVRELEGVNLLVPTVRVAERRRGQERTMGYPFWGRW